jgi:hypothetical protein
LRIHPGFFEKDSTIDDWGSVRVISSQDYYAKLLSLCEKLANYIKQGDFIGVLPKPKLDETGAINDPKKTGVEPTPAPTPEPTPTPKPKDPLANFFTKYGITGKDRDA